MAKVIITCASPARSIRPTMSDALPITPDEIAEQAIAAAEAGAAILHLHARDPQDGRPLADPEVFMQFLPRIKQATDAVINITTGGSVQHDGGGAAGRAAAGLAGDVLAQHGLDELRALSASADKLQEWKHEWEEPYLRRHRRHHLPQHLPRHRADRRAAGRRARHASSSIECYDVGHLYNLAHFVDRGLVQAAAVHPDDLRHPRRHRRRPRQSAAHEARPPTGCSATTTAGRCWPPGATRCRSRPWRRCMGGNVRVGLEDSLYIGRGKLATVNAEQVRKIRRILEELGLRDRHARPRRARCWGSRAATG